MVVSLRRFTMTDWGWCTIFPIVLLIMRRIILRVVRRVAARAIGRIACRVAGWIWLAIT